ncbi:MAG: FecR domain-containing protein [Pseudomonadota bacterium]
MAVDLLQAHAAGQIADAELDAFRRSSRDHGDALEAAADYLRVARSVPRRPTTRLRRFRFGLQLWVARLTQPPVAAAWALAVALGIAWLVILDAPSPPPGSTVVQIAPEIQVYETGWRERKEVTLQDGSQVWMDWQTTVSSTFSGDSRRVNISRGSAAFKVTEDVSKPFYVAANDLVVRVTGTEFTVKVESENRVAVEVLEGSVRVRLNDKEASLQAEQRLVSTPRSLGPVEHRPSNEIGRWRDGMLVFNQRPLIEALDALGQYLPYSIDTRDLVNGDREVTGVYFVDEAEKGLTAIIQSHRLVATPDGQTLRIQDQLPQRPRF